MVGEMVHIYDRQHKRVRLTAETHDFDEDGDLLLILSHPVDLNREANQHAEGDVPAEEQLDRSARNRGVQDKSLGNAEEVEETPSQAVHLLVSSKHMMLVSPVFKAMLRHSNFKEGQELKTNGHVEVVLPDDDPTPFIVLLNIIHGRTRKVPRKVDVNLMVGLITLIDKYQIQESVEHFSDIWFEELKSQIPKDHIHPLVTMDWLAIVWVLRKPTEFKNITGILEYYGDDRLEEAISDSIPVPKVVVDTIKRRRESALSEMYEHIDSIILTYRKQGTLCPNSIPQDCGRACDAMVLGSLLKCSKLEGIWPSPTKPYKGVSFASLRTQCKRLKVVALCDSIVSNSGNIKGFREHGGHGFHYKLEQELEVLRLGVSGRPLKDFLPINSDGRVDCTTKESSSSEGVL